MKKLESKEILFLIVIFLASVFIRWYKLPQNLFFGFEQGRDATIIVNIYKHHEFKLVGPQTDLPGIFHGAYYYYLLLLPYAVSGGNPLAASFFLVVLSSFLPIIMYFFAKDVLQSRRFAAVAAVLTAASYEYIIYARWLSNVTPAIPLILLCYYFLWLFKEKKKGVWFAAAAVTAAAASQFEIVLVMLFAFIFLAMLLLRVIPFPNIKTWLAAIVLAGALFIPHAIFNWRNQNIIGNSIFSFVVGNKSNNSAPDLSQNWHNFAQSYSTVFRKSLSLPNSPINILIAVFIVIGITLYWQKSRLKTSRKSSTETLLFLFIWLWMCLPVIFFHDVAQLTQLYLGVGTSVILLFTLALQELWTFSFKNMPVGKVFAGVCVLIIFAGWWNVFQNLQYNHDVFFITIQEGMNYADQRKLLTYAHQNANGKIYRLVAFTIPYLHPEGWQYLQQYFYPNASDDGSKLVYIVIEKQVDPFWQKKWTEDLGTSQLIDTKTFGLLTLEKRILK